MSLPHRPRQLEFNTTTPVHLRHEILDFMNDKAPRPVEVKFTRNRVTMLSVTFPPTGHIKVRLHEQYLEAPDEVIRALRTYVRTRRKSAWDIAASFGRNIRVKPTPATPTRRRTKGRVYDLKTIQNHVNRQYFSGKVKCAITWGRRGTAQRISRRSILYGSYHRAENLVRIHPALDCADVPPEFVEYIVFHEMLHALVPTLQENGRMQHHGPQFNKLEKNFPNWAKMQRLSKKLLKILD